MYWKIISRLYNKMIKINLIFICNNEKLRWKKIINIEMYRGIFWKIVEEFILSFISKC